MGVVVGWGGVDFDQTNMNCSTTGGIIDGFAQKER